MSTDQYFAVVTYKPSDEKDAVPWRYEVYRNSDKDYVGGGWRSSREAAIAAARSVKKSLDDPAYGSTETIPL